MSAESHFEHAVNIARDTLKALLLFNAGAAGALVALTDKTDSGHDYTFSILFFGCGALVTVITYVIAYLSQLNYANHCQKLENRQDGSYEWERHGKLQSLIFKLVMTAVFFSILGMASAFIAART